MTCLYAVRIAILLSAALLLTNISPAHAQAEAFAVGGAGGWSHSSNSGGVLGAAAGGVEALLGDRFSAGGEVGLMAGLGGNLLLNLSGTGRLRLAATPTQRTMPFVAGGYSYLKFFELDDHAFHAGVGIDHRVSPRRALRVEFRDMVRRDHRFTAHYWAVGIGLTFR